MSDEIEIKTTNEVKPKTEYTGKVLKVSLAGAVVEFDEGKKGVLHISQMLDANGTQDIRNVEDVLKAGQEVSVWIRKAKDNIIDLRQEPGCQAGATLTGSGSDSCHRPATCVIHSGRQTFRLFHLFG